MMATMTSIQRFFFLIFPPKKPAFCFFFREIVYCVSKYKQDAYASKKEMMQ